VLVVSITDDVMEKRNLKLRCIIKYYHTNQ